MIQFNNFKSIKVLAGSCSIKKIWNSFYQKTEFFFLQELSKLIRSQKDAFNYPDLISFSFWCRKGNLSKVIKQYKNIKIGLEEGLFTIFLHQMSPSILAILLFLVFYLGMQI